MWLSIKLFKVLTLYIFFFKTVFWTVISFCWLPHVRSVQKNPAIVNITRMVCAASL